MKRNKKAHHQPGNEPTISGLLLLYHYHSLLEVRLGLNFMTPDPTNCQLQSGHLTKGQLDELFFRLKVLEPKRKKSFKESSCRTKKLSVD